MRELTERIDVNRVRQSAAASDTVGSGRLAPQGYCGGRWRFVYNWGVTLLDPI